MNYTYRKYLNSSAGGTNAWQDKSVGELFKRREVNRGDIIVSTFFK
jgi:hypothetical protein